MVSGLNPRVPKERLAIERQRATARERSACLREGWRSGQEARIRALDAALVDGGVFPVAAP